MDFKCNSPILKGGLHDTGSRVYLDYLDLLTLSSLIPAQKLILVQVHRGSLTGSRFSIRYKNLCWYQDWNG